MTITVPAGHRLRGGAGAAHAYAFPVVRELPPRPADPAGDPSW
jgi:hypothetical protein